MKTYTFTFSVNGNEITTATFKGENKKEARQHADRYKRLGLKTDFPGTKGRVKIS